MAGSISSRAFPPLSVGSITQIINGENVDEAILQILGYKKVPGTGIDRYRLLLNDGVAVFPFAVLATQLNHLIETKMLEKFTIFKLTKYVCTPISNSDKNIIVCLEVESLVPGLVVRDQITQEMSSFDQSCDTSYNSEDTQDTAPIDHAPHSNKQNYSRVHQSTHTNTDTEHSSLKNGQPSTSASSLSRSLSPQKTIPFHQNSVNYRANVTQNLPNNSISNQNWDTQGTFQNAGTINQSHIVPVSSLTPYQNKWTVKARVIFKTSIVNYNSVKGTGQFLTFYLLDESGEIRVTAFNDQAQLLHNFLELNSVYYVSNARVKPSKGNSPIKHDFELIIYESTKIELANDESSVPKLKFNFVPINQIVSLTKDTYIDVIGVCCNVSEIKTIVTKANKEVFKLDLLLIDSHKKPVTVSLWGSDAQNFGAYDNNVIAIRNAKVTEFNGRSLTFSPVSMLFVDPPIQEAFSLRSWFENLGDLRDVKPISHDSFSEWKLQTWKTFAEITAAANFEDSDRAEYFTTKATVVMVQKEKCMYQSCPLADCSKKVTDLNNGLYKCSKCDKEYDSFTWKLLLSLNLADFSGDHWVVAFREVAESLIGRKTEELSQIKEENEDQYLSILSNLHFQSFIFKLRSKMEIYNEVSRLKTAVIHAKPVDPVSYTEKLLADIHRMERILM